MDQGTFQTDVPALKMARWSLPLLQQCWNEPKHRLSPPGSPIRADESNRDDRLVF
jgi:hypothetical protein